MKVSRTMVMTAVFTIGALAVLNRFEPARDAISGRTKFLGLF